MSYARWSSDDFQSDVYIYGTSEGNLKQTALHIAGNRAIIDRSGLPEVKWPSDDEWKAMTEGETALWSHDILKRNRALGDLLQECQREVIDHPLAGTTKYFDTTQECADYVEMLIAEGFNVPDGVVEALREDVWEGEYDEGTPT